MNIVPASIPEPLLFLSYANLNFPIARPQVLVNWAIIIALINNYIINYNKINKPSKNLKFINPLYLTACVLVVASDLSSV